MPDPVDCNDMGHWPERCERRQSMPVIKMPGEQGGAKRRMTPANEDPASEVLARPRKDDTDSEDSARPWEDDTVSEGWARKWATYGAVGRWSQRSSSG